MRAVNLIPAEQRSGSAGGAGRSQGGAYVVLGVLGGLALLALLYGTASHQVSSRQAEAAALNAKAQQAQEAATRLAPYTSFVALREQRTQAVATLVNSRFDWAHAFHELGRVLPAGVSVAALTGAVGSGTGTSSAPATATPSAPATASSSTAAAPPAAGAGTTSATPPGSVPVFTLSGCATSQDQVALTLNRLRLMDGVNEVTLQSSTKSGSAGAASARAGGCPGPLFSVQISFDPLPSLPASGPVGVTRTASVGGAR
jgi:Tfp pilus assembly protein PilN